MSGSKIVFVLTGSVAGYKACEAISALVKQGHHVRPVATRSALRFIGPATLEGLTREKVSSDLFEPGAALQHIDLTRWADLVIVCPASAHTINRFSAGLADDLVGALFLARDTAKPFLIVPAMNPAMWAHPATQHSVGLLTTWGATFVPVGEGRMACGETGEGRLAEPADIVRAVSAALTPPGRRLSVLVTSGGTSEPIDGVRVLTNTSTGRTGSLIAERLARAGHAVSFLRARRSAPAANCREETFETFDDLDQALGRLLAAEPYDAIIHAAAVGDFGVGSVEISGRPVPAAGKLDSTLAPVLRLTAHPKLVDYLRERSRNPDLAVVAFKLTRGASPQAAQAAVRALFGHSGADIVVHNDLSEQANSEAFPSVVYFADGRAPVSCPDRTSLARALERVLPTLANALARPAL